MSRTARAVVCALLALGLTLSGCKDAPHCDPGQKGTLSDAGSCGS
jgi:hypothetical protein